MTGHNSSTEDFGTEITIDHLDSLNFSSTNCNSNKILTSKKSPTKTGNSHGPSFTAFSPTKGLDELTTKQKSVGYRPYALDYDPALHYTNDNPRASGYRDGGPKEARLFRVALLKNDREVEHLHPVKITGIPPRATEESVAKTIKEFGKLGNVYIPKNLKTLDAAKDFAIIRFEDKEAAERAIREMKNKDIQLDSKSTVKVEPMHKHQSYFTMSTGSLGITNEAFDDGLRKKIEIPDQNIPLSSCLSRSGYPWGSKAELVILEPHGLKETIDMHALRIENLDFNTTDQEIKEAFECFIPDGDAIDTYCPRPVQIILRKPEPNQGFCFVRFNDRRDLVKALAAVKRGEIIIRGRVIKAEINLPQHWPNEHTRRYY